MKLFITVLLFFCIHTDSSAKRSEWIYYPDLYYDSLEVEIYQNFAYKNYQKFPSYFLNTQYKLYEKFMKPTYLDGFIRFRIWFIFFDQAIHVFDFIPHKKKYKVTEYYLYSTYKGNPFRESADSAKIYYSKIDMDLFNEWALNGFYKLQNLNLPERDTRGPAFYIEYNFNQFNGLILYEFYQKQLVMADIIIKFIQMFPDRFIKFKWDSKSLIREFG